MITISLHQIQKHQPCGDGWAKLLASKGGKNADMDAQFPVTDILESNDLDDTLWALRCLPEHNNLWRKYAVWCAKNVEHLMTDPRSIEALDVAWRHSEGQATDSELGAAWAAARAAARDAAWDAAGAAAGAAARDAAWDAAWDAVRPAARDAARAAWAAARAAARAAGAAARDAQQQKLIEILAAGEWVDEAAKRQEGRMNAIEQAIEALNEQDIMLRDQAYSDLDPRRKKVIDAITALQSLQGEAEPVAYLDEDGRVVRVSVDGSGDGGFVSPNRAIPDYWRPLYTHPQSPAVPDELTGEQWSAIRKVIAEYADKIQYAMDSEIESAYLDEAPKAAHAAMLSAQEPKP
jgi:hypothetical protein